MFVNAYESMTLLWEFDIAHDYFINTIPYFISSLQKVKQSIEFMDERYGILIDKI